MDAVDPAKDGDILRLIAFMYFVMVAVFLFLKLFLKHLQPDFPLLMCPLQVAAQSSKFCLDSSSKTRWAACGLISIMTFAFGFTLMPWGLKLVDALEESVLLSLISAALVWGLTYFLRLKALQNLRLR